MIDNRIFISNKGTASLFPLYLFKTEKGTTEKQINFSSAFIKYIGENYKDKTPEQILSYMYAVLYSPAYRKKYAEFLKSDFPRIHFTADKNFFDQLGKLGAQLITMHTAEKDEDSWEGFCRDDFEIFTTKQSDKQQIGSYIGSGTHLVEEVRFELLKDHETLIMQLRDLGSDVLMAVPLGH